MIFYDETEETGLLSPSKKLSARDYRLTVRQVSSVLSDKYINLCLVDHRAWTIIQRDNLSYAGVRRTT